MKEMWEEEKLENFENELINERNIRTRGQGNKSYKWQ